MKSKFIPLIIIYILVLTGCNNNGSKDVQPRLADEAVGSVLPFSEPPSASIAGESLAESKHQRRAQQSHLPADAPNIIIVLMDDVGFGTASTFGGEINTPTLSRVASEGITYQ